MHSQCTVDTKNILNLKKKKKKSNLTILTILLNLTHANMVFNDVQRTYVKISENLVWRFMTL